MNTLEKILTLLTSLMGGGWLAQAIYMRHEKRKKAAEARSVELDVDKKEDQLKDAQRLNAYAQIDRLQKVIDEERLKWEQLSIELIQVKSELLKEKEARVLAELGRCTVVGCEMRQPPRAENPLPEKIQQ